MSAAKKTAIDDPCDGGPPYRLAVLIVLMDHAGKVFVGERSVPTADHKPWQLPQGGICVGEDVAQAAQREIAEELGGDVKASVFAVGKRQITLNFTDTFNPKYRGQKLTPVLMLFEGGAIDVSQIEDGHGQPAFLSFRWQEFPAVIAQATREKQPVYQDAFDQLQSEIERLVRAPVCPDNHDTFLHKRCDL